MQFVGKINLLVTRIFEPAVRMNDESVLFVRTIFSPQRNIFFSFQKNNKKLFLRTEILFVLTNSELYYSHKQVTRTIKIFFSERFGLFLGTLNFTILKNNEFYCSQEWHNCSFFEEQEKLSFQKNTSFLLYLGTVKFSVHRKNKFHCFQEKQNLLFSGTVKFTMGIVKSIIRKNSNIFLSEKIVKINSSRVQSFFLPRNSQIYGS